MVQANVLTLKLLYVLAAREAPTFTPKATTEIQTPQIEGTCFGARVWRCLEEGANSGKRGRERDRARARESERERESERARESEREREREREKERERERRRERE